MQTRYSLFFLLVCFQWTGMAQEIQPITIPFEVYGEQLDLSTAGGFNAPQFSEADLNNDGILDVYVFDRTGFVHLAFLNEGIPNASSYDYAPELALNFPDSIIHFALLRDYNKDGAYDIFSYSVRPGVPGIAVYDGYFNADNELAFELKHDVLFYPGLTNDIPVNLAVLNTDIPDINDIDNDGDLDILTFDLGGSNVEWFRNYSVENGYGMDSLQFHFEDKCWGGFYEGGLTSQVFLPEAINECANGFHEEEEATDRHAGSSILSLDFNNDQARELILGDLSSSFVNKLDNAGNNITAFMNEQDTQFPSTDVPVDIPIFLGSYHLDLNNDGLKDLLFAPNNNVSIKDSDNVWYYRNTTSNEFPDFELVQKDLFVGEMLDLGTSANPAFVDYNGDGLLDLVVGNNSSFLPFGEKNPHLFLFTNVGTANAPAFELTDDNWLNFSEYASTTHYFSPTFGDLDGDGDVDMLVGDQWGSMFYVENEVDFGLGFTAGPVQPFYQELDVRNVARPTMYDFNKDGLMDIIVGERNGILNYFENQGSIGNPVFDKDLMSEANTNFLGQVNTRDAGLLTGHSAPNFITVEGETILVSGSEKGWIKLYNKLDVHPDSAFNKITNTYGNIRLGSNAALAIADIDNDNFYELLIGNNRGGLNAFDTDWNIEPVSSSPLPSATIQVKLSPNPSTVHCMIEWETPNTATNIQVFDQVGRVVFQQNNILGISYKLNVAAFAKGIYIVRIEQKDGIAVEKLVVE